MATSSKRQTAKKAKKVAATTIKVKDWVSYGWQPVFGKNGEVKALFRGRA